MKLNQALLILILGFLSANNTYSKWDKDGVVGFNQAISKKDVSNCKFDNELIDFCSRENLSFYSNHINDKINFSNNKILLTIDKKRNNGGEDRVVKLIVVLDPIKNMVFPLSQMVGNFVDDKLRVINKEPAKIEYYKNSNKLCLFGTTYSYKDNNINVENECYRFENGIFFKIVESDDNKKEKFTKLPYRSDIHFKCLRNQNGEKCNNFNLIPGDKLLKKYNFINPQDGSAVVLHGANGLILIVSPFQDEDGSYVRVMKVKENRLLTEKIIYAGRNVEIDKEFHLIYFEGSKRMVVNLN
ncbi:hypothetical protein [Acinetobacter sp. WCHAc010052]|uniref:hypothetical protein n=1 Tax=Acinetobacter sp. WCHAc010052 TaxID=2004647 RepID=UPI000B3BF59B|nr:hypothetical protein [Acinetobacter sp. WCHAc010052]AXY61502.1 hypothetical protein CDG61_16750 [Acinetobacter sp. WCHAc010052]